jgi:hypothetical protein
MMFAEKKYPLSVAHVFGEITYQLRIICGKYDCRYENCLFHSVRLFFAINASSCVLMQGKDYKMLKWRKNIEHMVVISNICRLQYPAVTELYVWGPVSSTE